jgi:hypothetical protein
MNTARSRYSIGNSADHVVSTSPSSRPPRKAPGTEPMPPTMAAISAFRPSETPPT